MVFADYRPYSPGDDTRHLDWGTYLRLDRLILRLFEEEADLPVYVFLDVSGSMACGEPPKFEFARRFAAALAYVALVNHDRVSVVAFADGIVEEMPARRGRSQVWRILHFLQRLRPAGETGLQPAVRRFFGTRRTRGLVLLISDFLDRAGFESGVQSVRGQRHDVQVVHVTSPDETSPALAEEVLLVDAEREESLQVLATPELLEAYRREFERHRLDIEGSCRAHGWGYLHASTRTPLEELILRTLREQGLLR